MAISFRRILPVLPFVIIIAMLAGCGGGGSSESGEISSGDPFPAKILSWAPPSQYTDGSSLDPVTDLDRFEIYIKEGADFSNADDEIAAVSATNPGTGQINTSFNLANLAPFLSQGVTYHVSVRTVSLSGLKSDFSPSATFSF